MASMTSAWNGVGTCPSGQGAALGTMEIAPGGSGSVAVTVPGQARSERLPVWDPMPPSIEMLCPVM